MERSLTGKRYLVFGGSGSIGKGIVTALLQRGAIVHAASRNDKMARERLAELKEQFGSRLDIIRADVTSLHALYNLWGDRFARADGGDHLAVHGIVYAVGNCPPGGFDGEVAIALTQLAAERILGELILHMVGFHNVSKLFSSLQPASAVVAISSAITRLTDEQCPPWLHAGHYAAAKAAQDELVRWLRRDPVVREKRILIHRLAPAAVNTTFHRGDASTCRRRCCRWKRWRTKFCVLCRAMWSWIKYWYLLARPR